MGRNESEFSMVQADGTTKVFTLVEYVTVDDMMTMAAQQVAAEIKFGLPYSSVLTTDVTDFLVSTEVGSRSG